MEMKKLKVKVEYMTTRCEVCHQADLWDPFKEECQRCCLVLANISGVVTMNTASAEIISRQAFIRSPRAIGVICLVVSVLMIAFFGVLMHDLWLNMPQYLNLFGYIFCFIFYGLVVLTLAGMEIISIITFFFMIKVMIFDEF